MKNIGPRQAAVLTEAARVRWILARRPNEYQAAMRLHEKGLLRRDPKSPFHFKITPAGTVAIGRIKQ